MKVVLFCGGLGMRLREHAENIPKPLVSIDQRPILWNVMKYYAHWGHKDFILCLGWKGEAIKNYFLNEQAKVSNDLVLSGNRTANRIETEIYDWKITFVDTGIEANVGQRLMAVRPYLDADEVFLANYTDGLSDLPLPRMIRFFHDRDATAAFIAVRPHQSWHAVDISNDGAVKNVQPISDCGKWMNGGFFVLHERIFDFMEDGDELVEEPFRRLLARRQLFAMKYDGFWSCMDTFKDKQRLEDMVARGDTPWKVWKESPAIQEDGLRDGTADLELLKQPAQP
jgi:glucose-1-phosphate cytidylyltransferase